MHTIRLCIRVQLKSYKFTNLAQQSNAWANESRGGGMNVAHKQIVETTTKGDHPVVRHIEEQEIELYSVNYLFHVTNDKINI